jgi:hypothetical protein
MSQTDDVSELLQKELNNGFIYGPFCKPPFEHYRVSPLGVATGKYSQKKSTKIISTFFSSSAVSKPFLNPLQR